MKSIILSLVFVWFLVIQSINANGGSTSASIPMQSEDYCKKGIEVIKFKVDNERWESWRIPQYNCVNAGDIKVS